MGIILSLRSKIMDLNKIYEKLDRDNIRIFPFGVDGIKAVTIEVDDIYGIFLNKNEIESSDEEFCVLAHEYGHCKSGSTHKLYSPFDVICRHEYRADRKSISDFLPFEKIVTALENGCQTIYEVSNYLDMPEEFVSKAIRHYTCMGKI
jgi:hypothetical protein